MRWLIGLLLAVFGSASWGAWDSISDIAYREIAPGQVLAQASGTRAVAERTYANTANGWSIIADKAARAPGPRGDLAVTAKRVIPPANVARALFRSLPVVATAAVVIDLLDDLRCAYTDAQLYCDTGEALTQQNCYKPFAGGTWGCSSSGSAAGAAWLAVRCAAPTCTVLSVQGYNPNGSTYSVTLQNWAQDGPGLPIYQVGYPYGAQVVINVTSDLACAHDGDATATGLPCVRPQAEWLPAPAELPFVERVEDHAQPAKVVAVVPEIDQRGIPIVTETPYIEGPTSIPGVTRTELRDGVPVEITTRYPVEYEPPGSASPGYTWGEETTTPPPPGSEPGTPGTTTNNPPAEFKTCGLPGTPACKIDETGTPTQGEDTAARDALGASKNEITGAIETAKSTGLPWVWGFSMPEGTCSNLNVSGAGILPPFTVDICGSPITQIWRALWAWCIGILAALYAWRQFTSNVGAS